MNIGNMTVGELIRQLQAYDEDRSVILGMEDDVHGTINHVRLIRECYGGYVLISHEPLPPLKNRDRLDQLMEQIDEIKAEIRDIMS